MGFFVVVVVVLICMASKEICLYLKRLVQILFRGSGEGCGQLVVEVVAYRNAQCKLITDVLNDSA